MVIRFQINQSSDDVVPTSGGELQDISEKDDVFATEKQPMVKALYAYTPQRTKDVAMKKGEVLKLINTSNKAKAFKVHAFHFFEKIDIMINYVSIYCFMLECMSVKV